MKTSIILFYLICTSLLLTSTTATAQKKLPTAHRCGLMERLESVYKKHPDRKTRYEQNVIKGEKIKAIYLQQIATGTNGLREANNQQLTTTVYIPVIVHIVLPNADEVTDNDIYTQLNSLNTDYAGLNADSSKIPAAFKSLFGKSKIQFKLARRTPGGRLTSGIERRNSNTGSDINQDIDPIKRTSLGGLDAWDFNKYLNLWIGKDGSGLGLLGYATLPGDDIPADQGVFINSVSWGTNVCYVTPEYALGRTLVHELGHYFGLYHIWGDKNDCTGNDFRQLPGTCEVNASSLTGDTPPQAKSTSGCLNGVQTDICSPASPGFLYQNYMDYTFDACYALFTPKQVARMEWIIENCRSGYLTSDGATMPPGATTIDASPTRLISPGGYEITGCNVTNYAKITCATTAAPKILITNNGINTLTSFTTGLLINGVAQPEQIFSGSLPFGQSKVITFPNYAFADGNYTLQFYTRQPNGTADQVTTNDTLSYNFIVGLLISNTLIEDFETNVFPPSGWNIINPDAGSMTWEQSTNAAKTGVGSAFMNFYNYSTSHNDIDYLLTPLIDAAGADSILLSFDRAYRPYSTTDVLFVDTLLIKLSTDCGNTFPITVWKKGNIDLATNPIAIDDYYTPIPTDWKNETIDIKPFIGNANKINIAFVGKNGEGQNLYLDNININIVKFRSNNTSLNNIIEPSALLCEKTFTPAIQIRNSGADTIKTLNISCKLNNNAPLTVSYNQKLPSYQYATINFSPVTVPAAGKHTLTCYTSLPNGMADQNPYNDTLIKSFYVFEPNISTNIKESFEQPNFPPTNWSQVKSNNTYTWQQTTRSATDGSIAAWIRNRKFRGFAAKDDLYGPIVKPSSPDSILLNFDVAHALIMDTTLKIQPNVDTLEILITQDCGKTLQQVYKKWGKTLQTTTDTFYLGDYTDVDTVGFIPKGKKQWRSEAINLTPQLTNKQPFQVVFRNINNNGNNLFIDNINIRQVTLPAKLKQQGYMIAPNPTQGQISVRHSTIPNTLKGIIIYNTSGQAVNKQQYTGNAASYIALNLGNNPTGVYFIKLLYTDKVITERVIKTR